MASPQWSILFLLGLVLSIVYSWTETVSQIVPEPYLDEVFHVPQAQAYWAGHWRKWDPKITTPPGLYIYSVGLGQLASFVANITALSTNTLRATNGFLLLLLPLLIYFQLPENSQFVRSRGSISTERMHTSINIMLFPLFFFFSALYYTDVLSAFMVIGVYSLYTHKIRDVDRRPLQPSTSLHLGNFFYPVAIYVCGLFAMLVRQTNVFWVAVFLGGLQAVESVKLAKSKAGSAQSADGTVTLNDEQVFDPSMGVATIEDYFSTTILLSKMALSHLPILMRDLFPYVALLATFVTFVLWNGGVVLGDRDNHVASIHLPQMLYLWPSIVFFSWPVLLPLLDRLSWTRLPRSYVAAALVLPMILIIHFNTIIHPFTLADNRHYVFYIFRILLRHPVFRYAAVPVYAICAWLVLNALGLDAESRKRSKVKGDPKPALRAVQETQISFVLVWLASTALSLVTAPLVEPRYFIIPWLIWRLSLVTETVVVPKSEKSTNDLKGAWMGRLRWLATHFLWLETLWYLLVNSLTCYTFLYKGFGWPQEPGKVQRFMW